MSLSDLFRKLKDKHEKLRGTIDGSQIEGLIEGDIRRLENAPVTETFICDNIHFIESAKRDVEELCGFFDFEPFVKKIAAEFHRGELAYPNSPILRLKIRSKSGNYLCISYAIDLRNGDALSIWVVEVSEKVSELDKALGDASDKSKALLDTGLVTSVTEIIKFALRNLFGA